MAKRRAGSGVPAGQVLRKMRDDLERGWPAGLTVLTGDDAFHLDRAQKLLLERLGEADSGEFGTTVFGEEKVDLSTVVAAARSVGMFATRRIVLVRDVTALQGEVAALQEYASAAPPSSFLIVRAPVLDQRRKLHKALAAGGKTLRFQAVRPEDTGRLIADVRTLATEAGLELETPAMAFLAQVCAGDLYRVESELGKLAAWPERGSRRLDLETVQEIAAGSGLLSGWAVADAVLMRDLPAALEAVRRLTASGDEPLRIVGGLSFRARSMLTAKAMLFAGMRLPGNWAYGPHLQRGLARYTLEELLGFPALLLRADRSLKSRSIDRCAVLEALVEGMIAVPDRTEVRA